MIKKIYFLCYILGLAGLLIIASLAPTSTTAQQNATSSNASAVEIPLLELQKAIQNNNLTGAELIINSTTKSLNESGQANMMCADCFQKEGGKTDQGPGTVGTGVK
jgi:hypothetical protein